MVIGFNLLFCMWINVRLVGLFSMVVRLLVDKLVVVCFEKLICFLFVLVWVDRLFIKVLKNLMWVVVYMVCLSRLVESLVYKLSVFLLVKMLWVIEMGVGFGLLVIFLFVSWMCILIMLMGWIIVVVIILLRLLLIKGSVVWMRGVWRKLLVVGRLLFFIDFIVLGFLVWLILVFCLNEDMMGGWCCCI